jgi:tetratricopeptide (TPR) repeat protein
MFKQFLAVALALLGTSLSLQAQALIMKDGSSLGTEAFKVEGGKLYRIVNIAGAGGQNATAQSLLPINNVAKIDWPDVQEITDANQLLAAGKTAEAVAELKKGKDFFEPFEKVEGSPYALVYLAYVDALSQSGNFEETMRAIPGLKNQKLSAEQQMKLKIIQLNMDRLTSSNPAQIIAQAENILADTDDSSVSASLWMIMGDTNFRAKKFEEALMAYLHVPVFFGTQVQKVPEAELNAARCLKEMRRFEDASGYYARLIETYPGSGVATTATNEKASINGMKNDESGQGPAQKPAEGEKKEGEAKPADAAKPAEAPAK